MGNTINKGKIPFLRYKGNSIALSHQTYQFQHTMMRLKDYKHRSIGERMILHYAEKHKIPYLYEFKHPNLPELRYDFVLLSHRHIYFVEFDGEQHFKYSPPMFHKSMSDFLHSQQRDILKTKLITDLRSHMIRIDFTQIHRVDYHLTQALYQHQHLYLSTPNMYDYVKAPVDVQTLHKYQVI